MNQNRLRQLKTQLKSAEPDAQPSPNYCYKLPESLHELEQMAQEQFVPRLEAIFQAALAESGTIRVKRGDTPEFEGEVLVDLVFGRKDQPNGSWTAYLVRMELDPRRNEVCMQAGLHLHMNRTIAYGTRDWENKLIDGFEWLLSDSMRSNLRIRQ